MLETHQLGHCVTAIENDKIDGRQLLEINGPEFIDLLQKAGIAPYKARIAWADLQRLIPAGGHAKHTIRALIVGIDNYHGDLSTLRNSVKDALAMKTKLESAGVEVTFVKNVTIDELKAETDKYVLSLNEGDVGILFYAGHGHMFNNTLRLMAIPKGEEPNYDTDTLMVEALVNQMSKRKTEANLLLLDCCRDFRYKATTRGTPNARSDTVISYACAPNHSAHDGDDVGHGLYTECVLRHILTPNIDVIEMLTRIECDVEAFAANRKIDQVSQHTTSLKRKLYLFDV